MINNTDYLLGFAMSLLMEVRQYLITAEDSIGITLIEDRYQNLYTNIEQLYYNEAKKKGKA